MTRANPNDFDPDWSIEQRLDAEVLDETDETYFVRFGEDEADILPKTPINELLFEADETARKRLYDLLVYGEETYSWGDGSWDIRSYLGESNEVTVTAADGGRYVEIDDTPVPGSRRGEVIETIAEHGHVDSEVGPRLLDIKESIENDYVRRTVITEFLDRYPEDRVRPTRNGWVIDDSFVIQYDATNRLLEDETAIGELLEAVQADESREFVDLDFDISGTKTVEAPNGESFDLDEREQRFLALVEVFLYPEDYLGYDLSGKITDERRSASETEGDGIEDIAATADDGGFTDPSVESKSHGHELDKHTLTGEFSVTDEVIDRLHFQQNTHGGVSELARRESEFRRADFDVFHDTDNDDDERWQSIKAQAKNAPISDEAQQKLDAMFGRGV